MSSDPSDLPDNSMDSKENEDDDGDKSSIHLPPDLLFMNGSPMIQLLSKHLLSELFRMSSSSTSRSSTSDEWC